MTKEMEFFIYLIEHYAYSKGKNTKEVFELFEKKDVTKLIYEMYEKYHTEAIENAYDDIDKILEKKD